MLIKDCRDRWDELSGQEQTFVEAWLISFNPHSAALEAKYAITTARSDAWSWVKDPRKKPALYETCMYRRREKMEAGGEAQLTREFIERLRVKATADPRELIDQTIGACRYCWGERHEYQWKEFEYEDAVKQAERTALKERKPIELPDLAGGFGYRFKADPNPACPRCEGEGEVRTRWKDLRDLSPAGVAIYKGLKIKKDGSYEIIAADQDAAGALFSKITGIAPERMELSGPGGAAIPTEIRLVAAGDDELGDDQTSA